MDIAFAKAKSGLYVPSPAGVVGFQRQRLDQIKKASAAPVTFDPVTLSADTSGGGSLALSQDLLTLTRVAFGGQGMARATGACTSGKFYFEASLITAGTDAAIGLVNAAAPIGTWPAVDNGLVGGVTFDQWNGNLYVNSLSVFTNLFAGANPVWPVNHVTGYAVDLDRWRMWVWGSAPLMPAGQWNLGGTANPATGVGGVDISALAGLALEPFAMAFSAGQAVTMNFGKTPFALTVSPPSGFNAGWLA